MTLCWVAWCLGTSGDLLSARNPIALAAMGAAGIGGGYVGFNARSRFLRVAVPTAALVCVAFWIAVPDGWWATSPPLRSEIRLR